MKYEKALKERAFWATVIGALWSIAVISLPWIALWQLGAPDIWKAGGDQLGYNYYYLTCIIGLCPEIVYSGRYDDAWSVSHAFCPFVTMLGARAAVDVVMACANRNVIQFIVSAFWLALSALLLHLSIVSIRDYTARPISQLREEEADAMANWSDKPKVIHDAGLFVGSFTFIVMWFAAGKLDVWDSLIRDGATHYLLTLLVACLIGVLVPLSTPHKTLSLAKKCRNICAFLAGFAIAAALRAGADIFFALHDGKRTIVAILICMVAALIAISAPMRKYARS